MNEGLPIDDHHVPTVSEARLSSVLDTAVDGIIVIDARGRILIFNAACERLFGFRADEVVGENVRIIMPADYADHHDTYIDNYHRTGVRRIIGIGREVKGKHRDGTVFPIELSVGECGTPDGRQFVGILRDLRPRKEAERRLSELQSDLLHMARVSAMDEMGAAIAHELNQPLTAIMLYLQALDRTVSGDALEPARPPPPPPGRVILLKALREAERAGQIIQRMRSFVEKRGPERKRHDLRVLVDEAVELTLMGQRSHVRVFREYGRDLPHVLVDAVQVQQILVNLLRNAFDAVRGATRAEVRVVARDDHGTVCVDIIDSGTGIPADMVPTLFKAFSSTKKTGLGLGLAISKSIAQNHGGDVLVEPGGHGRGATFTLVIPPYKEQA